MLKHSVCTLRASKLMTQRLSRRSLLGGAALLAAGSSLSNRSALLAAERKDSWETAAQKGLSVACPNPVDTRPLEHAGLSDRACGAFRDRTHRKRLDNDPGTVREASRTDGGLFDQ